MKTVSFPQYELFQKQGTGLHIYNGSYLEKHNHLYIWECFFVLQGKLLHHLNGKDAVIGSRQLFLMRPHDYHFFSPMSGAEAVHACFFLTKELARDICNGFSPTLYDALMSYPGPLTLSLSETQKADFLMDFQQIQTANKSDLAAQATLIKMLFARVIKLLYYNLFVQTETYPDSIQQLILRMKSEAFIDKNVGDITMNLSYSHMQLYRLFKQYTGKTIINYFKDVKFNYACSLLETTNFTVLEICNRIGFSSLSHFTREFEKKYGITPAKYRRSNTVLCK